MMTRTDRWPRSWALVPAVLLLAAAAGGCPVDESPADARPADAASQDAATGDAGADAGFCEGGVIYEVRATAWQTGDSLAGVAVGEVDEEGDTTGADGVARVCLPLAGGRVAHEDPDLLPWRAEVDGEVAAIAEAHGDRFRVSMMSDIDADEVFVQDLGVVRDPEAAQVVVDIRAYPGGDPVEGARAQLVGATFNGPFAGAPGDAFASSDTLAGDPGEVLLFANAASGTQDVDLEITPPESRSCAAPDTAVILDNAFTYIPVACTPAE